MEPLNNNPVAGRDGILQSPWQNLAPTGPANGSLYGTDSFDVLVIGGG